MRPLVLVLIALLAAARPAAAQDYFGVTGGYARAIGKSNDFASDGTGFELRYRHHNRNRSAFEIALGYVQMGLDGEVQNTIAFYDSLTRYKNFLAQLQGGPGNGFIVAEFGVLEVFHLSANLAYVPWKGTRVQPFLSVGGGAYNWRLPFRIKWNRTPFFGEQRSWDPVEEGGIYAGVGSEEVVDFTKHTTSGGLSAAAGATYRLTRRLTLDAQARVHLVFSSGQGNREEKVDDQDYLDNMRFLLVNGALNWRF